MTLPSAAQAAKYAELAALYAEVDAEIAAAAPRCEMSGRCCNFKLMGHELWATALETAYARRAAAEQVPEAEAGLCPWHVEGLCTLRDGRPLGCRTYFCDSDFTEAGQVLHERMHRRLAQLHETHAVPYRYERFVDAVRVPGPLPSTVPGTVP